MKKAIVKYFRHDRSYAGAVDLYMKYGNRIGLKKTINMQPENDHITEVLHEELRILAEIDPAVFRVLVSVPVVKEVPLDPTSKPEENPPAGKTGEQTKQKSAKDPAITKKEPAPKKPKAPAAPKGKK